MKRFCFFLILLSRLPALGDEGISAETLRAVKDATVYIKVEAAGQQASGSGFLVKLDGATGYIVTNHHVADPKFVVLPPGGRGPLPIPPRPIVIGSGGPVTLTVVFASGTRKEQALKAEGRPYRASTFPMLANSRAKANGDTEGFVKLLADGRSGVLVGAHIVGEVAGTMIAQIAQAMEFGATAEDVAYTCHAHPTHSEAVKEAALGLAGAAIHL